MTARKPPRKSRDVTTGRTADVSLDMGGLGVRVEAVPLADAGLVASYLLTLRRELVARGWDELLAAPDHVGADRVDVPEEDGVEEFRDLPTLAPPARRKVGF